MKTTMAILTALAMLTPTVLARCQLQSNDNGVTCPSNKGIFYCDLGSSPKGDCKLIPDTTSWCCS
ncbi:uncharacterized protein SETTUDRAFT_29253 [Exserohilum turcica Et28A]|uniref:Uncharacterized protein n=1 Tax=Exserohilum turcicum (strain 28A) TaxID=671987 RepID=R0K4J7_EXST2|nr:uncharacterized protein SETTUDRAFT_29253 [Exserohilum turcica Et28A]EOA84469.1 hypothetical protein SETTUDRAFT_29253 [Exserohilum turcica Et28A]